MKAYNAIFKNGQFYLAQGDKLIIPLNNTEVVLIVEKEGNILIEDGNSENYICFKSAEKEVYVNQNSDRHAKILMANEKLYFYVKVGSTKHKATAILLEDLYLYSKISWKSDEAKLFDCVCQMISIEGVDVKEPITSFSVSDLYKRVYIHYNANKGNPSANALTTFYIDKGGKFCSLDWIRSKTTLLKSKL